MYNLENIEGEILQVIYSKTETGFAVIRVKDTNNNRIYNAVGSIQGPKVGAIITMKGYWHNSEKHGVQFKVVGSEISVPENYAGIIKYLGSKFVNAVGPKSARRIVNFFGEKTIHVLENDIDQLATVPGIGPVKARNIKLAWNDQRPFNTIIKRNLS